MLVDFTHSGQTVIGSPLVVTSPLSQGYLTWQGNLLLSVITEPIFCVLADKKICCMCKVLWSYTFLVVCCKYRNPVSCVSSIWLTFVEHIYTQRAKFMGPTWGPPGSCWPQMGPWAPCGPHEPCYQGLPKCNINYDMIPCLCCCCYIHWMQH